MLRKLLRNKKGTAEIIGSVMFIVILLFFFTNVYLWHDAATKEMNNLYVQKINSPITIEVSSPNTLTVTNKGGMDATLSKLWINEQSTPNGPDVTHLSFDLNNAAVVKAGMSIPIDLTTLTYDSTGKIVVFKVITTAGNSAACSYP